MDTDVLYHGTKAENVRSIIQTGEMKAGADGRIFFARYNWPNAFMHGVADTRYRVSCVIKVRVQISDKAVRHYTETRGVRDTLIVEATSPLRAEVLELHARLVGDEAGSFVFEHLKDQPAILVWLASLESREKT